MSEELKEAMADLAGGIATLTAAVQEAKSQFNSATPADVEQKLLRIAEDVTALSGAVKRIDEAPALKRVFDSEGAMQTKRISLERKLRLPSTVSGDEDMKELFEYQDALEVLRFVKRFDASFDVRKTKSYEAIQAILQRKDATFYDGTAGQGAEWIPTGYSPDLVLKFELRRLVAGLFTVINMPNDPFKIPRQTARAKAYLKGRGLAPTESESTTDSVTLSTQTIAAYSRVVYEMEEDSIIAMLPFIRQDLAQALADAEEDAIINGDTTGSHMDEDVTAPADVRKAWDGLRKTARIGSDTFDMGAPSTEALRGLRAMMGKYATSPRRLAYIVSPVALIHMLGLEEVITMEKYGPNATIVTGELGRFDGTPVIPSGLLREDMSATGIYDSDGNHSHTGILLVDTNGFVIGRKRAPMIESFRDIVAGVDEIVASMREDFKSRYPSTEPIVAYAYDIPNTITVGS